ncbi:MAG: energy transducer TonB [Bacteroidota bacterium]
MRALRDIFRPFAGQCRSFEQHRRLLRPLGISLLAHALVLWPAAGLSPTADSAAKRGGHLRASLQPLTQPAPLQSAPVETAGGSETVPQRAAKERSYPAPASEAVVGTASADSPAATDESVDRPLASPRPGVDVGALREYHLALGRVAGQFRRYPPEARQSGWQGRVVMRLVISDSGAPLDLSLLDSSNYPLLDQAALDMIRLAAGHTRVPDSLRGQAFTIDLAIDFSAGDSP